jgi:hypothetical protein
VSNNLPVTPTFLDSKNVAAAIEQAVERARAELLARGYERGVADREIGFALCHQAATLEIDIARIGDHLLARFHLCHADLVVASRRIAALEAELVELEAKARRRVSLPRRARKR